MTGGQLQRPPLTAWHWIVLAVGSLVFAAGMYALLAGWYAI